jgi:hypothetical protein
MINQQGDQESKWLCCDDGTGKNIYYINREDGSRLRSEPAEYLPEAFSNGMKRYYFRGSCTRCRKKEFPTLLSMNKRSILFSVNLCQACIHATTIDISSLSGPDAGDIIFNKHENITPFNLYRDLRNSMIDKERLQKLLLRAQEARRGLQIDLKLHRDSQLHSRMREIARQYGVFSGRYLSWGLGKVYDEYFGEVNNNDIPHGRGMRIFADKSMYIGNWKDGLRHTSGVGVWIRPDGYDYEGSWISDMKHGHGVLKYPNGDRYDGEFARDLEHGNGTILYVDGTTFEGRFRFGKRDGPGVLTKLDGTSTKDHYRDYVVIYNEKPLIKIMKEYDESAVTDELYQPESLFDLTNQKLSYVIRTAKIKISPSWIRQRMPDHLKPPFAEYFLKSRHPLPSDGVIAAVRDKAFVNSEQVSIGNVRFHLPDIETLIFFQSANSQLTSLRLIALKLDAQSIALLCQHVNRGLWMNLQLLDLSYNRMDVSSIRIVVQTCSQRKISALKLAYCNILANSAFAIASILRDDVNIKDLDISFNNIKGAGAEALAEALINNSSLESLNLRGNDIGTTGGSAFADLLLSNRTLKVLCLADNKVGPEIIGKISGRINGSIKDVMSSVRALEINIPARYEVMINREV